MYRVVSVGSGPYSSVNTVQARLACLYRWTRAKYAAQSPCKALKSISSELNGLETGWTSASSSHSEFLLVHMQELQQLAAKVESANRHQLIVPLAHCRLNMAVGCFRSPVRRSGTRCLTSSEIRRVVLTVLSSFLRRSCLVFTNVTSALEVFLMLCAISIHVLLTYLEESTNFGH